MLYAASSQRPTAVHLTKQQKLFQSSRCGSTQELGLKNYARMDGWVLFPLEASTDSAAASESDGDEASSEQPAAQSSADEQPQPAAEAASPDAEEDANSPADADADSIQAAGDGRAAEAAADEEPVDTDERSASDEVGRWRSVRKPSVS